MKSKMKYGLLYFKETENVGDDIQTYAAKRFLPSIDYIIDRESTNLFLPKEKEYVSVIMNAWYLNNKASFPPSPYINPLLISMNFDKPKNSLDEYLVGVSREYLQKHQPIGARDISTQKYLKKNKIETFFSGCMTLTIEKLKNIPKKDYICVIDTNKEIIEKIKNSTDKEVRVYTHTREFGTMKNKTIKERMTEVENLLKEYQAASLVITDRLHGALPSTALETPTILIRDGKFGEDRIETFERFIRHYTVKDFLNMDITDIINNPKPNKQDYLIIRKKLIYMCNKFIKNTKQDEYNTELLPEINQYAETAKRLDYSNKLYLNMCKKLEEKDERLYKATYKNGVLKKDIKYKNDVIRDRTNEIYELKRKNDELQKQIYNSKIWKTKNLVAKIFKGKN